MKTKKPWQMTQKEYVKHEQDFTSKYAHGSLVQDPTSKRFVEHNQYAHGILIEDALKEGKPVPAEVLKDYPDLQAKPPVAEAAFGEAGKPKSAKPAKKPAYGSEIINYGGMPVRFSTAAVHLEKVAKSTGKKDWMGLRDAGLMGLTQRMRRHPDEFPDDVQPLTLDELELVTNLPSGKKVPEQIWRKWITMYPKEERWRFDSKSNISDLRAFEDSRSERSQSSDERQKHSLVIEPDDTRIDSWKKDAGRMDVQGIDTPNYKIKSDGGITKSQIRKLGL